MKKLALILSAIGSIGNQSPPAPDIALYQRALSDDATYEFHCHGVSFQKAQQRFDQKYKIRQDRLRSILAEQDLLESIEPGGDRIAIGFKCPHYRGAEARLRSALRQAERRAGVAH